MSSRAVQDFRRLMGDGEEANSTPSDAESKGASSDAMENTVEDSPFTHGKALPADGETPAATKNMQHGKQTVDADVLDKTQDNEANTTKNIDRNAETEKTVATVETIETDETVETEKPVETDENAFAGMTNPFSRLFSDTMSKMQPASADVVPDSSTADLAEKLVERILVSQSDKNGQEVRLLLSQESGINAEVRIVRDAGGGLHIALHAEDATTFQNLVAAQDRLKATLDAQERGPVRVEVLSQTDQEDNDANRRSRGYMQPESED
ncbi:MAG: hypothetical protein RR014_01005 [Bilophila sp.]